MIGYQYVLEIDVNTDLFGLMTYKFCCEPAIYGAYPYIIDPGLYQVQLFSGDKTTGASSYSYGEVILSNFKEYDETSGDLDFLTKKTLYGCQVRMFIGNVDAVYPTGFNAVYTAIIESVIINWDNISLTLRGRQAELDKAVDGGIFIGDGSFFEGSETLKDKRKPILIGRAFNFTPTLCNATKQIYAVSPLTGLSANEIGSDLHIYDNGVELYFEKVATNITTQTALPGHFIASTDGYISLGAKPAGTITCSAAKRGYALSSHPSNLISYLLTLIGCADMIDDYSFSQYILHDREERGIYITTEMNISDIIDKIMSPLGYWYFSPEGKMILGRINIDDFDDPQTAYTLDTTTNVSSFCIRATSDTTGGIPPYKVTIQYAKNYTVQTQLAGSVDTDRAARLKTEWLYSSISGVQTPLSEELIFETALSYYKQELMNELYYLYVKRVLIDVVVNRINFIDAIKLHPGQYVSMNTNGRFIGSKKMIVLNIIVNYVEESVTLTLWG